MSKKNINPVREVEREFGVIRPLIAVMFSMILCFIIIFIASAEPFEALKLLITGPLSTVRRFGNVIETWIPFMFTGCAICILYSANVINMAAEGAFFLGGLWQSVLLFLQVSIRWLPFWLAAWRGQLYA